MSIHYQKLKDMNLRVISIAADENKDVFEATGQNLAWSENYCDFQGFAGVNFLRYKIIGTPTIFVIDGAGIITGRNSQL
jgi:hypothetical protein